MRKFIMAVAAATLASATLAADMATPDGPRP
jgi:hypothetical protein